MASMSRGVCRTAGPRRDHEMHSDELLDPSAPGNCRTQPNNDKLTNNAMMVGTLAVIPSCCGCQPRAASTRGCHTNYYQLSQTRKKRCREPGRKPHAKEFYGHPPT